MLRRFEKVLAAENLNLQPSEIHGETKTTVTARERTGVIAWLRRRIDWLDDPKPVFARSRTKTQGMSRDEWRDWMLLHSKHKEHQEKLRERERRKQM